MMFYIVILTDIPQMFPFRRYLDKSIDPIMSHFILPMDLMHYAWTVTYLC